MKKIGNLFSLLAALFLALSSAGQLAAQPPASVTLVKAAHLLDPRTGNVLSPAAVLIEGGKIKQVGTASQVQASAPAGAKTIDLGTATLLPGLIDSHTHLLVDPVLPAEVERARRFNGSFVPDLLLAIVAQQTSVAGPKIAHRGDSTLQIFPSHLLGCDQCRTRPRPEDPGLWPQICQGR